jgi:5'-nucleotidase
MELFGVKGWALDGTPADCVNAAIYNILDSPPDLVISGINAGMNAGLSFILSSGTVGACFEANIAGIPGIALSQQFDAAVHRHYVAEYALPADVLERLRGQTDVALSLVFDSMLKPILDAGEPMTWNVNIPFLLTDEEALWRADPGQTFYHQLFERDGNRLHHNLVECTIDSDIASDAQTIRDGRIAVTPLDFRCFGAALPASAQKLASKYLKEVSK